MQRHKSEPKEVNSTEPNDPPPTPENTLTEAAQLKREPSQRKISRSKRGRSQRAREKGSHSDDSVKQQKQTEEKVRKDTVATTTILLAASTTIAGIAANATSATVPLSSEVTTMNEAPITGDCAQQPDSNNVAAGADTVLNASHARGESAAGEREVSAVEVTKESKEESRVQPTNKVSEVDPRSTAVLKEGSKTPPVKPRRSRSEINVDLEGDEVRKEQIERSGDSPRCADPSNARLFDAAVIGSSGGDSLSSTSQQSAGGDEADAKVPQKRARNTKTSTGRSSKARKTQQDSARVSTGDTRSCSLPVPAPSPASASSANQTTTASASATPHAPPSSSTISAQQLQQQQQQLQHSEKRLRQATLVSFGVGLDAATVKREIAERDARITELEAQLELAKEEADRFTEELARRDATTAHHDQLANAAEAKLSHYQTVMRQEMLELAKRMRNEARRNLYDKQFELGQIATWQSNGQEIWIEGRYPKELILRSMELQKQRDDAETMKKLAEKRLKITLKAGDEDSTIPEMQENLMDAEEAVQLYTFKYTTINAELATIAQQQNELKSTKRAFVKEIHRVSYEDGSDFNAIPAIGDGDRYILMTLLGKGGYSEVWKAFDIREGRYVACKIHRVAREWAVQRRTNYLQHAQRELDIMQRLDHPRLTKLYDVFHFNAYTFVSVMECCRGTDLDTYLKRNRTMRETEAKLILLQVVSALRCLAAQEQPIIHYDLKPANILFEFDDHSCLDIKITDFGLSKIIHGTAGGADGPSNNPSIDLTSPGAGTLWYLPPECFETGDRVKINNKVDVWSVGVIYYQMLFGKLPFADGESQQRIWREKLIISSSRTLDFPDTPKVSSEAKDLIRKCLVPNVSERYDISQLSADPYLLSKRTARIMKAP